VEWRNLVFLHFVLSPEEVRPLIHPAFQLELHEGMACISLAAVTMRRFRPCSFQPFAQVFRFLTEQRFLNVRAYVRAGDEPGALFLWGWLSRPPFLPAISGATGLPFSFGKLEYDHRPEQGFIHGFVRQSGGEGGLEYRATFNRSAIATPCPHGSLGEHAMERYSGFFSRRGKAVVFRAWHPPWLQIPLQATVVQRSLIENQFPWFKSAELTAANFTPGFDEVWLGRAHRLDGAAVPQGRHRHGAFFELP
jgi:uncharacterized protein YqjF (DUF2071 family)